MGGKMREGGRRRIHTGGVGEFMVCLGNYTEIQ